MKISIKNKLFGSFFGRSIFLNLLFVLEGAASFAVDLVIAAGLGLGIQSDGLYAAWAIPQAVGRGMFQSLTNSFMGLFANDGNPTHAYNQAITVILVTAFVLASIFSLLSFLWLPFTIPGSSPETVAIAIPLAAILSWLVGFLALSETFRAIYYREKKESTPSIARLIGALVTILVILFAAAKSSLMWVAWGILLGAAFEAGVSFVGLRWQLNYNYRFSWPEGARLRQFGSVIGPPLVGQGIRIIAGIVQIALASLLAPGSITAVTYANRMVSAIERFAFRGFIIATIQSFTGKLRSDLSSKFRIIILISIPVTIAFGVLAQPLIGTLFGRGRFQAEDVIVLAVVLQAYALAIMGLAITRIPFALAYAFEAGRVVLLFFVVVSSVLIGSEILLLNIGFGLWSFGIAQTLALIFGFIMLYLTIIRPQHAKMLGRKDVFQLVGVGLVSAILTAMVVLFAPAWPSWLTLSIGGLACLVGFVIGAKVFKLKEYDQVVMFLRDIRE